MSTQEDLNWDDVLGSVEAEEKENPSSGNDFEALPKGPQNIVVQDAEKQVSNNTGADMIKMKVQVTGGPYANRVLFKYLVFKKGSPKAMRITLEQLSAFGITREFIGTQKPSISQIAELLVGREAVAIVGIQGKEAGEYEGRNEIKSFRKLEGATQPAPQVADAKPAGVPSVPQPEAAAPAAVPTPSIPTPDVPVGAADAENPFG